MWNRTLRGGNKGGGKSLSMLTQETPIKKCPSCSELSLMTHSRKGYTWCPKCSYSSGDVADATNGKRNL